MNHFALPPGPRRPALLQAAWLAHRPFRYLEWCRDNYGDTFTINTPPLGRTPVFSRPDHIEQLLELDGEALHGGIAQSPLVDFAGERSLMKLDGPPHQDHREILTRALSPSALPGGGANLLELIRKGVAHWPVGQPFDLGAATDRVTMALVSTPARPIVVTAARVSSRSMTTSSGIFHRIDAAHTGPGETTHPSCPRNLPPARTPDVSCPTGTGTDHECPARGTRQRG